MFLSNDRPIGGHQSSGQIYPFFQLQRILESPRHISLAFRILDGEVESQEVGWLWILRQFLRNHLKKLNPWHWISLLICCFGFVFVFLRKAELSTFRILTDSGLVMVNQLEKKSCGRSMSKFYSSSSHMQLLYIHSLLFS